MAYQTVFKRYELKYLLTRQQKALLLQTMASYMAPDEFGHSTIRNIYFDTDTFRLIRRSLEKPAYKEKLRLRSYGRPTGDSPVFVELKKKYQSVVYKRRVHLPQQQALSWLSGQSPCPEDTQITREINYFLQFYKTLRPAMFLSYEREAFYPLCGGDFRVTFDENILFRRQQLSLESDSPGTPLLGSDQVLMELKTPGGIPLWMSHFLTQQHIYQTSFSKYGAAYQNAVLSHERKGQKYA